MVWGQDVVVKGEGGIRDGGRSREIGEVEMGEAKYLPNNELMHVLTTNYLPTNPVQHMRTTK